MNTLTKRNVLCVLAGAACVGAVASLTYGSHTARVGFAAVVTMMCVALWAWSAWPLVQGVVR